MLSARRVAYRPVSSFGPDDALAHPDFPTIELPLFPLEIGGQLTRELGGRYLFASASILAGPQRRKITGALAFSLGAQGGDGSSG